MPAGTSSISSPTEIGPPVSVPVTTVPAPVIENTRSRNCLGRPVRSGSGAAASIASSAPISSSSPRPVADEQAIVGQPSSRVPLTWSADLGPRELQSVVVREVGLGERDHRAVHAQHVHDLQVFLGLRLPPLVGGHHEQHQAHRADPREHRPDEAFVAGHVHEPQLATRRERAPRVAELDRQAAALLLVEPVGVHAVSRATRLDFPWSTCPAVATTNVGRASSSAFGAGAPSDAGAPEPSVIG
jgi:hypothetical protein